MQRHGKESIKNAQAKQKLYFDKSHAPPAYQVGDLVLINNARRNARKGDKLARRWTGPHEIETISASGVVKVKGRKAKVSNMLMKPYRTVCSPEQPADVQDDHVDNDAPEGPPVKRRRTNSITVVTEEPAPPLKFNSVGEAWQTEKSAVLGIEIRQEIKTPPILTGFCTSEPAVTVGMRGDGNCFFRSLVYFCDGSTNRPALLREITVPYMKENKDIFSSLADNEHYVENSNMGQLGVYATEIEIFAGASWLSTPIWTFSPYGDGVHWQCHRPVDKSPSIFELSESVVYLKNLHEHFEPVLGI